MPQKLRCYLFRLAHGLVPSGSHRVPTPKPSWEIDYAPPCSDSCSDSFTPTQSVSWLCNWRPTKLSLSGQQERAKSVGYYQTPTLSPDLHLLGLFGYADVAQGR